MAAPADCRSGDTTSGAFDPEAVSIGVCEDVGMAEAVSALCIETFAETFGHIYCAEDFAAYAREKCNPGVFAGLIADPAARLWLARAGDDSMIGYALAGPCDLPMAAMPANAGELMRLYVRKASQGRGLGVALLEGALGWLDGRFDAVFLSVFSENHGAQRLYARYGFQKVGEYDYMVGAHADREFILRRTQNRKPARKGAGHKPAQGAGQRSAA